MKFLNPFLVLILILDVIGILGCLGSDTSNQSSNRAIPHVSSNIRLVNLN